MCQYPLLVQNHPDLVRKRHIALSGVDVLSLLGKLFSSSRLFCNIEVWRGHIVQEPRQTANQAKNTTA